MLLACPRHEHVLQFLLNRLGHPISDEEDPAAVKWKSASFNFYDKRLLGGAWQQEEHPEHIRQFMRVLAVCHTVIPDGEAQAGLLGRHLSSVARAAW